MLIIGERINGTRKKVGAAIKDRDADHIKSEASRQADAGAAWLDVNAGTVAQDEVDDIRWLVETIRSVTDKPLCIDSPNPEALRAGLEIAGANAMVNSITGEKKRLGEIAPLVKEFNANVICLLMDDSGLISGVEERVKLAGDILSKLESDGIGREKVYFDPTVKPVSTEPDQGVSGIRVIAEISSRFPEANTTCGLSNISFGLPNRHTLNATYLAQMMASGLDSAIIDPLNKTVMTTLKAAHALLGQDEMCMEYIQAARAGNLK